MLGRKERQFLLDLARKAIEEFLKSGRIIEVSESKVPKRLLAKASTFTTVHIGGKLRGCIGTTEAVHSIYKGVIYNALSAAFSDFRFEPLTRAELSYLSLEISILKDFKEVKGRTVEEKIGKVKAGKHGVILRKGPYQALFLPQVWEEVDSFEEFFRLLSLKAGMSEEGWKEADFTVFEVEKFR